MRHSRSTVHAVPPLATVPLLGVAFTLPPAGSFTLHFALLQAPSWHTLCSLPTPPGPGPQLKLLLRNSLLVAGPILAQAVVPVYPTDRPEQLAARVLKQEHQLYPR